jgi:hypothetical protein
MKSKHLKPGRGIDDKRIEGIGQAGERGFKKY